MNNLVAIIKRKGLLESVWYGHCCIWQSVLTKIKVYWLQIRGYDIDPSVVLRGRNIFFQSNKKAIQIDKNCEIGVGVKLCAGFNGSIRIDKGVGIYDYTMIDVHSKLEIGENTLIAPFCYITDYDHVTKDRDKPIKVQGYKSAVIEIGKNVWIGAKTVILKGVTIGNNSVVGAGSVVTRDVPANSVAVGSPARVIKNRK